MCGLRQNLELHFIIKVPVQHAVDGKQSPSDRANYRVDQGSQGMIVRMCSSKHWLYKLLCFAVFQGPRGRGQLRRLCSINVNLSWCLSDSMVLNYDQNSFFRLQYLDSPEGLRWTRIPMIFPCWILLQVLLTGFSHRIVLHTFPTGFSHSILLQVLFDRIILWDLTLWF